MQEEIQNEDSLSFYSLKEDHPSASATDCEFLSEKLLSAKQLGTSLFEIERVVRGREGLVCKMSVNYNRKDKSLEELSRKFIGHFQGRSEATIQLDRVTKELGVQRRRIYDIINIMESLKLVQRRAKNTYIWNGLKTVQDTVDQIATKPREDLLLSLKLAEQQGRKEKSLQILSIGFMNLFINWKRLLTLQVAAKKLSPNEEDPHKLKTKIRRLYDIANVFKSLGLVRKTQTEDRKPGFYWVGLPIIDCSVTTAQSGIEETPNQTKDVDYLEGTRTKKMRIYLVNEGVANHAAQPAILTPCKSTNVAQHKPLECKRSSFKRLIRIL